MPASLRASETASASARKRKSRGKGLRTRTGCQRCRSRRVKCDERRPSCRACEKSGRECIYASEDSNQQRLDRPPTPTDVDRAGSADDAPVTSQVQTADYGGPFLPTAEQQVDVAAVQDTDLPVAAQAEAHQDDFLEHQAFDHDALATSPESNWSGWANLSAEAASLSWFGLLATDATNLSFGVPDLVLTPGLSKPALDNAETYAQQYLSSGQPTAPQHGNGDHAVYVSQDNVVLSEEDVHLFQHFVLRLSGWIDVTDPDRHFAVVVPQMALKNRGLMSAILALSACHLSLKSASAVDTRAIAHDRTSAVEHYHEALKYLQREMASPAFLRSDELLATVLTISTYEMVDGSARGWERHLKGVFWIQRSQLIHGESHGLKKRIWWAWMRQDIWVAYRERRKILSYYQLTRPCASLDSWELVDRAVWLLGQCINYASFKESDAGKANISGRVDSSSKLWGRLTEWYTHFESSDRRLPTASAEEGLFTPIWINPVQASLAMQVHHFSRLLLLEHTPAVGGFKELAQRQRSISSSVETICGIASCTRDDGAIIVSTLCTFAAGAYVKEPARRGQVDHLLQSHRRQTGWPPYDLCEELHRRWAADDD